MSSLDSLALYRFKGGLTLNPDSQRFWASISFANNSHGILGASRTGASALRLSALNLTWTVALGETYNFSILQAEPVKESLCHTGTRPAYLLSLCWQL